MHRKERSTERIAKGGPVTSPACIGIAHVTFACMQQLENKYEEEKRRCFNELEAIRRSGPFAQCRCKCCWCLGHICWASHISKNYQDHKEQIHIVTIVPSQAGSR